MSIYVLLHLLISMQNKYEAHVCAFRTFEMQVINYKDKLTIA